MPISNYRLKIIAAFLLLFAANIGQTFFLSLFNTELNTLAQVTTSELGNWYALATLVAGFTLHFSGALIDHYSFQRMSLVVLIGASCGGVLMAVAPMGINLLLIYFLLRFFAQGMATHIAYTSVSRVNHPKRGMAISIIATAMPIGEALLPISIVFMLAAIGWQWLWLSLSLGFVALSLLAIMLYPKTKSNNQTVSSNSNSATDSDADFTRQQVLRTGKFWLLVISIMFPAFAITALFFHQQIWLIDKHLSLVQFAAALSLYALTHVLGSLLSGWMVDRVGLNKMLRYYMLPMTFAVFSLLFLSGEVSLYSFMFLSGITVGASGPVSGSLWPILYGSTNLGAIRGTITALMVISTAIAPALVGGLSAAGWNSEQLLVLLAVYGVISVLILKFIKLPTS